MSAPHEEAAAETAARRAVRIFFCGDVMTGRGIDQVLPHPCEPRLYESYVTSAADYVRFAEEANGPIPRAAEFSYVWGAALPELARAPPDLRIVNLETSITRSDAYVPKGINYRMSSENAGCLHAAGIDCCVLANNHVLDWGRAGLLDTLSNLERLGIKFAGAGSDLAQASAPAVLDVSGGGRVIVFSLGSPSSGIPRDWAATGEAAGVNLLPDFSDATVARIADDVARVRRAGDLVIASIHWGSNWGYDIPEAHRRFAHALVDQAGVSVVHGHSSHHPKAIEVHRNRLILYGCGDFLDDYEGIRGYEEFRDDLVLMYFASLDAASGDLIALDMVPLQMRRFQLVRPSRSDVDWLLRVLDRESGRFGARVALKADGRLALA
jgi:poly-gamma-glutamate capsule biosynthesis protein CapA/YwtB (metallophosphatase superfamily)